MRSDRYSIKRDEILGVTWRLIATQGLRAASMRTIAAAGGYVNGVLGYYFSSKEELLREAFAFVTERTERRIEAATEGKRGLAAVRDMCREILPSDADKVLEARVVLPFFAEAALDRECAELLERALVVWRGQLRHHVREAVKLGEVRALSTREVAVTVEQLLTMMIGAQVTGVLVPAVSSPRALQAMLNAFLEGLAG